MTVSDLAAELRGLADRQGDEAREWWVKGHIHKGAWHQGRREAYLHVIRMLEADGPAADPVADLYRDLGGEG